MRCLALLLVLVACVALAACNGFTPQQPGNGGAVTVPITVTVHSDGASPKVDANATHSPATGATGGPQSATADVRPDVNVAPAGAAGALPTPVPEIPKVP